MTWFKGNGPEKQAATEHEPRSHQRPLHVAHEVEERLAKLLVTHHRLQERSGRPLMHLLGVHQNQHDGTIDYSVRSRVHDEHGKDRRFDSTIRLYPSGHLRLVR